PSRAGRSDYGTWAGEKARWWGHRKRGSPIRGSCGLFMDRQELVRVLRAPARAIRGRAGIFVLIVAGVVAMNLVLPPFVLSVVRKPYDYFSINPWLHNVPSWLASGEATASRKVDFVWNVAVLWFVASGEYDAAEWGFTVTVADIARWALMGVLFGACVTLCLERRTQLERPGVAAAFQKGQTTLKRGWTWFRGGWVGT